MKDNEETQLVEDIPEVIPDEDTHLFIFGNLKIIEKETGEIVINKRF